MGKIIKSNGSSLIEVMVALFVLAIGILGVLAMQSKSMQFNQSSYAYTQAVYMTNDIAERINANAEFAVDYEVTSDALLGKNAPDACVENRCDKGDLVDADLARWLKAIQTLPGGKGSIEQRGDIIAGRTFLVISVSFDDNRSILVDPGEEEPETLPPANEYQLVMEI